MENNDAAWIAGWAGLARLSDGLLVSLTMWLTTHYTGKADDGLKELYGALFQEGEIRNWPEGWREGWREDLSVVMREKETK
jgi:hypothetical protein